VNIAVNNSDIVMKSLQLKAMIPPMTTLQQIVKFAKCTLHVLFPEKPQLTSYAIAILAYHYNFESAEGR